jgi:hypothetical protein
VVVVYALTLIFNQPPPSAAQLIGAGLIIVAILFLSPLHHGQFYLGWLKRLGVGDIASPQLHSAYSETDSPTPR